MVCGYFDLDPVHDGHKSHFREAAKLADKLIVAIHQDRLCVRKKGFCHVPLEERMRGVKGYLSTFLSADRYEVVVALDTDGTVARTIRWLRPNILAKGGDRSPEDHPIPQAERAACAAVHCEIVYNVGEPKRPEWSSTRIALEERALKANRA